MVPQRTPEQLISIILKATQHLVAVGGMQNFSYPKLAAETLGVSRQSVSTWENGFSDPNTSNLIALAKLYKISPEQLLECAAGMPDGENNIE